mgnify:FL=1|jgi:hypothetical protein
MPTKTYLIPKSNLRVFEQGFQRMNELASIFAAESSEMNGVRATYSVPASLESNDVLIYIMLTFGNKRMSEQKNFDHQKYIDLRNNKARVVEMSNQ